MFALVDVNSFYASCEAVFRPDLKGIPIVVLSNNDGCVIARNAEAKLLNIKMGMPFFQLRDVLKRYRIEVFSSNYALYNDMSERVMQLLKRYSPNMEVYSIDEAFLDVTCKKNLFDFGVNVRAHIAQCTGLTVGVGIAQTKTLAKLANFAAKKWTKTGGVVDLTNFDRQRKLMSLVAVEDVWGVGRNLAKKLNQLGIYTALNLANSSPLQIRKRLGVILERTVRELNGESCIPLEAEQPQKKQIIFSRSFGNRIDNYQDMKLAISHYTERAAENLRKQKQRCKMISVFIQTSYFDKKVPVVDIIETEKLSIASNDTRQLVKLAIRILDRIFCPGKPYKKAGVILSHFSGDDEQQIDLFQDESCYLSEKSTALMAVIDKINASKYGKIWFAGQGVDNNAAYHMKRNKLSPAYTTRWSDIPVVKIK